MKITPDGLGGFDVHKESGIGAIVIIVAVIAILTFVFDLFATVIDWYGNFLLWTTDNGVLFISLFIITNALFFLQQIKKISKKKTMLSRLLSFIVAPSFILYIYASLVKDVDMYAITESDGWGLLKAFLLLMLTLFSPVLAIVIGSIYTFLITKIARAIGGKGGYQEESEGTPVVHSRIERRKQAR